MIGFLSGTVLDIRLKEILLLTQGGVGYTIFPAGSLLTTCQKGKTLSAEILTVVRENGIALYGFGSPEEKHLFEKLIAVSGIGPKTAIQIIAAPPAEIQKAIEEGNVPYLTKIPGLGKKTAERLIIEMRGKLDLSAETEIAKNTALSDAIEALQNLGYDRHTITKRLEKADQSLSTEGFIKTFLSSK